VTKVTTYLEHMEETETSKRVRKMLGIKERFKSWNISHWFGMKMKY